MPLGPRRRRFRPCPGSLTILIPPPGDVVRLADLDDALSFGVVTDLFQPFGLLVAWLDARGQLLHLAACAGEPGEPGRPRLDPAERWSEVEGSGGPSAASAVVYRRVPDQRVLAVVEADLDAWRRLRSRSRVTIRDWILVGPNHLRSLAVTTGTADLDWEGGIG